MVNIPPDFFKGEKMMLNLTTILTAVGSPGAESSVGSDLGGGINMAPVVLRLVGSLALIFFIIFLLVVIYRRYGRSFSPQAAMSRHVRMLGSYPIEAKKKICLVQIFDRVILMGVGPMGLTALAEFDQETINEQLAAVAPISAKPVDDFRQLLKKLSANIQNLKGAQSL
jgi:flagellar biogenesis protein FliO